MSYCTYCECLDSENLHRIYHDHKYGFPIPSDNELFGRLILEINQAGLSWDTILKKEINFRQAFNQFDIDLIAGYSEDKISELLSNSGIIRNRLKILAVIHNAKEIQMIQRQYGSFLNWLELQPTNDLDEWVKIFKRTFKFVGKNIVEEFLMSTGFLPGAHQKDCPIYDKVLACNPNWCKI